MAKSGLSGHASGMSALPLTTDIVEPCAPRYFGGGKFGGRSFRAITQEGNYASARDPLGGLPTPGPAARIARRQHRARAGHARAGHHQGTAGPRAAGTGQPVSRPGRAGNATPDQHRTRAWCCPDSATPSVGGVGRQAMPSPSQPRTAPPCPYRHVGTSGGRLAHHGAPEGRGGAEIAILSPPLSP